jgi:protein-tyrosine phosphatase
VIDLHSHILWAVDDGPSTPAGSLQMARDAVADGIRTIAATPHVRGDFPTSADEMERSVASLRATLEAERIPLEVRPGGEIALDRLVGLSADELRRFGLAGNSAYLLVETPYTGWPSWLPGRVLELAASGVTPVLAHPERNREVQGEPERLRPLVDGGTLVQITAASLDGRLGGASQGCARRLLDLALAHLLASDAHEPHIRRIGMSRAAAAVGDEALARWLTEGVPGAIVAGTRLPERPDRQPRPLLERILG